MNSKKRISTLLFIALSLIINFSNVQTKTMISFMGAPGAGKGTLAGKCITELKYTSLSVGNLLREEIAKGTALGKKAECIKTGKLASDELVVELVKSWLISNLAKTETIILDGFPRTAHQAELFLNLLHTKFNDVSLRVIDLKVSDQTVIQRISNRLVCEKCQEPTSQASLKDATKLVCAMCEGKLIKREDDKEKVVRDRLKVYVEHAELLRNVHKRTNVRIDCIDIENKTPQQVFEAFKELLGIVDTNTTPAIVNIEK